MPHNPLRFSTTVPCQPACPDHFALRGRKPIPFPPGMPCQPAWSCYPTRHATQSAPVLDYRAVSTGMPRPFRAAWPQANSISPWHAVPTGMVMLSHPACHTIRSGSRLPCRADRLAPTRIHPHSQISAPPAYRRYAPKNSDKENEAPKGPVFSTELSALSASRVHRQSAGSEQLGTG